MQLKSYLLLQVALTGDLSYGIIFLKIIYSSPDNLW